ncbi:hypothetical protein B7P43_G02953 [Cryptotermes secundus]|uniref:Uncharacterized protein n=1 Tax=Cryptotermes secundus TaxID=105785 RepID=A0A2J7Q0Z3_9NEOP|nr:hypothetical protein B7P43_G02953 [Cryptotermes secundus]
MTLHYETYNKASRLEIFFGTTKTEECVQLWGLLLLVLNLQVQLPVGDVNTFKAKLFLQQAVEAHRVVICRGSLIF